MSPYRQRGKPWYYDRAYREDGTRETVWLGTKDRATAKAMGGMLARLRTQRRWDLLHPIADGRLAVGTVYDADQTGRLDTLLRQLAEIDLTPHVASWLASLATRVSAETVAAYGNRVATFGKLTTATLTTDALTRWVAGVVGNGYTKQNYAKAMHSFCTHVLNVGALRENPMATVPWPKAPKTEIAYLTTGQAERLVNASSGVDRIAYALAYGGGLEVSAILRVCRRDVTLERREVFAPGTKNATRERMVRIAAWAWPIIEGACKTLLPDARLCPLPNRHGIWYRHRALLKALDLPAVTLHDARHHWAVRAARAGTPAELIARQLGHVDATMVLKIYGRFMPSWEDRERWAEIADEMDKRERVATPVATQRAN